MSGRSQSSLELEALYERSARPYREAVQDLLVAIVMRDRDGVLAARRRLEEVTQHTMGMAELLGARDVLERAATLLPERVNAQRLHFATTQTLIPNVTFQEAVDDFATRVPVTVRRAAERTAERIAQLYGEGRVVAFAKAAEAAVTKRAADLITEAIREGVPEAEAGRAIAMGVDEVRKRTSEWSEAYARMAFRTNVGTATTAGRFRQLQDNDVREVIPALRFDAVGDVDTRDNHAAADGLILRADNTAWNRIAPPLGYNCRCTVAFIDRVTLRRMGRVNPDGSIREDRVPQGAHPDPGFRHGGRPDLLIVQGAA